MRPERVSFGLGEGPTSEKQWNVMTTIISKFRRAALVAGIALSAISVSLHAEAGSLKLGMTTWVGYGPLFLARDMGEKHRLPVDTVKVGIGDDLDAEIVQHAGPLVADIGLDALAGHVAVDGEADGSPPKTRGLPPPGSP